MLWFKNTRQGGQSDSEWTQMQNTDQVQVSEVT